jgi:hypothetical protein
MILAGHHFIRLALESNCHSGTQLRCSDHRGTPEIYRTTFRPPASIQRGGQLAGGPASRCGSVLEQPYSRTARRRSGPPQWRRAASASTQGIFSAEAGAEFRDAILPRGYSEDSAELYRKFMGRDPDPTALLARSGLLASHCSPANARHRITAARLTCLSRRCHNTLVHPDSVRTSIDLARNLHRRLHEAASRQGCSARQLILRSIERAVQDAEPAARAGGSASIRRRFLPPAGA